MTNRETAFVVQMADDVIREHTEDGCCAADEPCAIVKIHLKNLNRIGRGWNPSTRSADLPVPGAKRPNAGASGANQYGSYQVKAASGKQVTFVKNLLASRDTSKSTDLGRDTITRARKALTDGNLSKKLASSVIDILLGLPELPNSPAGSERMASDKQVSFIRQLAMDRGAEVGNPAALNMKQASDLITELKAKPASTLKAQHIRVIELGMYRTPEGRIFRIYEGRTSKRHLAKELVGSPDAGYEFVYAGLASNIVKPEHRMTLEEAKEWGAQTGYCCNCGALLTDPESVSAGIGPICGKRF